PRGAARGALRGGPDSTPAERDRTRRRRAVPSCRRRWSGNSLAHRPLLPTRARALAGRLSGPAYAPSTFRPTAPLRRRSGEDRQRSWARARGFRRRPFRTAVTDPPGGAVAAAGSRRSRTFH